MLADAPLSSPDCYIHCAHSVFSRVGSMRKCIRVLRFFTRGEPPLCRERPLRVGRFAGEGNGGGFRARRVFLRGNRRTVRLI